MTSICILRIAQAAADVSWQKWTPCSPTSAHWYSSERFEELVASYIAAERSGAAARTVREFIAEFRGLTSTGKQSQVAAQAHLERAYLHDLTQFCFSQPKFLSTICAAQRPNRPNTSGDICASSQSFGGRPRTAQQIETCTTLLMEGTCEDFRKKPSN